jgi:hypothetical protein
VSILRTHRGETRVYINVETAEGIEAQIECHASMRVACSGELLRALSALLGRKNVCVLGRTKRPIPFNLNTAGRTQSLPVPGIAPSQTIGPLPASKQQTASMFD